MPKFARGTTTLTDAGVTAIKNIAKNAGADATFTVTGVAGKLPGVPTAYVEALALSRAEKLKAYFIKLGVKESNITVKIKVTEPGVIPKTKIIYKSSAS
jgi:outer membrane protein OmpA-like peptidoglycan-associated protein